MMGGDKEETKKGQLWREEMTGNKRGTRKQEDQRGEKDTREGLREEGGTLEEERGIFWEGIFFSSFS